MSDSSRLPIFALQTVEEDEHLVVHLTGELDLAGRDTVAALGREIAGCAKLVTLDLSRLDFVDSSGLAALVKLQEVLGGALRLRSPSRPVARALEVSGLEQVFTIER